MKIAPLFIAFVGFACLAAGCNNTTSYDSTGRPLPDPRKETFSIAKLVKENKLIPDSIIRALNAQHHQLNVLERRTVPGPFNTPGMKYYSDYVARVEALPVINPGPGEYVHVMEGQRNGYENLTIGITETFPNGAPPMHSHEGEESHVLLDGEILYALGDTLFTIKAPYIVNIPAGMPHAFKNIGDKTANLVVIFPTNIWKYDVLDFFPFKTDTTKPVSRFSKFKNSLAKKMSIMENKHIARSFYESYNDKNLDKTFDDFIATDLVNHTMGGGLDRQKWLEFDKALLAACPDLELVVRDQITEGDRVVTHWLFKGTHTGEFMDMCATGKEIKLAGISIDAIEKGKIKEHLAIADFTGLIQQFS